MFSKILAAAVLMVIPVLTACQTTSQPTVVEDMTTPSSDPSLQDAKAAVLGMKNTLWVHPENIVDASITPPLKSLLAWTFCVRIGSKALLLSNTMVYEWAAIAMYNDGRPPKNVSTNAKLQCLFRKPWEPFPELLAGDKPPAPVKRV